MSFRTPFVLTLILACRALAGTDAAPQPVSYGPSLPSSCKASTYFFSTTAPLAKAFFVCGSGNKWAAQDPKAAGIFVVQNFGAKGDGSSDDLQALQAAANAATAVGSGIVFFPSGTYLHSDVVNFGSNTLVQGVGDSSRITAVNDNRSALRFQNISQCAVMHLHTSSAAVNRLTVNTSAAILFQGAQSCLVQDVSVEGSASVGIMIQNSSQIVVNANRVVNTRADGIHAVDGSHDVLIAFNRAYNTGDDSFAAVAYNSTAQTANVTIDSNVSISSHGRGVSCIGAANCTITNNKIYNSLAHGIAVAYEAVYNTYNPSGAVVQHNLVRGVMSSRMNGLLIDGANNVQVSDLQVYDSSPVYCHASSAVQLAGVRIFNALTAGFLSSGCGQFSPQNVQVFGASTQPAIPPQGVQGAPLNVPAVAALSDNGMISVFGNLFNKASAGRLVQSTDLTNSLLPQNLNNTCVEVGGSRGYLLYVSPVQVNVISDFLEPMENAGIEVVSNCGQANEVRSNVVWLPVLAAAPQFFLWENNGNNNSPVVALDAITNDPLGWKGKNPAKPGQMVSFYMAGMGSITGLMYPGLVGSSGSSVSQQVTVSVGGIQLSPGDILYCGTNSNAGMYQLNLRLPKNLPAGSLPIQVTVGGAATPQGAYLLVDNP